MATFITKLEAIFAAAAFAEAGEQQTALEIAGSATPPARRQTLPSPWLDRIEKIFAAVAFAEHGMHEVALSMAGATAPAARRSSLQEFVWQVGLSGVPVFYGVART